MSKKHSIDNQNHDIYILQFYALLASYLSGQHPSFSRFHFLPTRLYLYSGLAVCRNIRPL